MWMQGQQITALIIAFCAVIAPGGYIVFLLTVLLAVRRPPARKWVGELLRGAAFMQPWSMVEVMILGILIALIKIAELALVEPGIGMYAVGALVVLLTAIGITFNPDEIWRRIEWVDPRLSATGAAPVAASPEARA
jgi:paraquat-inducible protein A